MHKDVHVLTHFPQNSIDTLKFVTLLGSFLISACLRLLYAFFILTWNWLITYRVTSHGPEFAEQKRVLNITHGICNDVYIYIYIYTQLNIYVLVLVQDQCTCIGSVRSAKTNRHVYLILSLMFIFLRCMGRGGGGRKTYFPRKIITSK